MRSVTNKIVKAGLEIIKLPENKKLMTGIIYQSKEGEKLQIRTEFVMAQDKEQGLTLINSIYRVHTTCTKRKV